MAVIQIIIIIIIIVFEKFKQHCLVFFKCVVHRIIFIHFNPVIDP